MQFSCMCSNTGTAADVYYQHLIQKANCFANTSVHLFFFFRGSPGGLKAIFCDENPFRRKLFITWLHWFRHQTWVCIDYKSDQKTWFDDVIRKRWTQCMATRLSLISPVLIKHREAACQEKQHQRLSRFNLQISLGKMHQLQMSVWVK